MNIFVVVHSYGDYIGYFTSETIGVYLSKSEAIKLKDRTKPQMCSDEIVISEFKLERDMFNFIDCESFQL